MVLFLAGLSGTGMFSVIKGVEAEMDQNRSRLGRNDHLSSQDQDTSINNFNTLAQSTDSTVSVMEWNALKREASLKNNLNEKKAFARSFEHIPIAEGSDGEKAITDYIKQSVEMRSSLLSNLGLSIDFIIEMNESINQSLEIIKKDYVGRNFKELGSVEIGKDLLNKGIKNLVVVALNEIFADNPDQLRANMGNLFSNAPITDAQMADVTESDSWDEISNSTKATLDFLKENLDKRKKILKSELQEAAKRLQEKKYTFEFSEFLKYSWKGCILSPIYSRYDLNNVVDDITEYAAVSFKMRNSKLTGLNTPDGFAETVELTVENLLAILRDIADARETEQLTLKSLGFKSVCNDLEGRGIPPVFITMFKEIFANTSNQRGAISRAMYNGAMYNGDEKSKIDESQDAAQKLKDVVLSRESLASNWSTVEDYLKQFLQIRYPLLTDSGAVPKFNIKVNKDLRFLRYVITELAEKNHPMTFGSLASNEDLQKDLQNFKLKSSVTMLNDPYQNNKKIEDVFYKKGKKVAPVFITMLKELFE